jgi:hypothetical protein
MSRKSRVRKERGAGGFLNFLRDGDARYKQLNKNRIEVENRRGTAHVSAFRLAELAHAELVALKGIRIGLTEAGHAHLARIEASSDPFLVQHEGVVPREKTRDDPLDAVLANEAESPLAWLAKRKGPDGKPLIDAVQFQAGDRLRADFTRAGLTPRVTSNWIAPIAQGKRAGAGSAGYFSDSVLAAKERMSATLETVGPEFAGVLLDVCCFLKGLEIVEGERGWPRRTAKVVLGLALDRLARHYGIRTEIRGPSRVPTRTWRAPDARPTMNGGE